MDFCGIIEQKKISWLVTCVTLRFIRKQIVLVHMGTLLFAKVLIPLVGEGHPTSSVQFQAFDVATSHPSSTPDSAVLFE